MSERMEFSTSPPGTLGLTGTFVAAKATKRTISTTQAMMVLQTENRLVLDVNFTAANSKQIPYREFQKQTWRKWAKNGTRFKARVGLMKT